MADPVVCSKEGDIQFVASCMKEIKEDIKLIKQDLSVHMARTAASEARIEIMEQEVKESKNHRDAVLQIIVKQAEKARVDQLKTIKFTLGIFAAIAALVTALASWLR
jgi:hypothetical protein